MSSQTRRSSISSSTAASSAKRLATDNAAKLAGGASQQPKKRHALANLTNRPPGRNVIRTSGKQVQATATTIKAKKVSSTHASNAGLQQKSLQGLSALKQISPTPKKNSAPRNNEPSFDFFSVLQPCHTNVSPCRSDGASVSMDETMSSCDSLKSQDIEYIDNADDSAVASLDWQTCTDICISKDLDAKDVVNTCNLMGEEMKETSVVDVDYNQEDPQLCASFACDIYMHLREAETKRRPSTDFMEQVQKDINASMRGILIDWLVEVAEEYRLVPETLHLTVNYIDRYLSGNSLNRQQLQLLGVVCMWIAAKYEEICAPQVEDFCFITDNTYYKEEVLQMEAAVLRHLKFEMSAPTAKCFLRRFVRAAHGTSEVPMLQLEFLASYLAELSLLEYEMLCYSPSLIAASATFLANFILQSKPKKPWNATLEHYTLYKPSELCECVKALHRLSCKSVSSSLAAVREKYSQHKYKFVAKKCWPLTIPLEFFLNGC